jgi:hypothetical protein
MREPCLAEVVQRCLMSMQPRIYMSLALSFLATCFKHGQFDSFKKRTQTASTSASSHRCSCCFRAANSFSCTSLFSTASWQAKPKFGRESGTLRPPPTLQTTTKGQRQERQYSCRTPTSSFQEEVVLEAAKLHPVSFSHPHLYHRQVWSPDRRHPHRRPRCRPRRRRRRPRTRPREVRSSCTS